MDPLNMGGGQGDAAPDAGMGMDLDSLLGTSPEGDTTGGLQDGLSQQGAGNQGQTPYQFAGRTWKGGQKEAETAWNKLYGQYSEQKGLVNQLKAIAQKNPELARQLAGSDPKMASILSKFGIEAAERENAFLREGQNQDEMSWEAVQRELGLERHQNRILREEWAFERKLGRPISDREQQAVYKQLERSENLSYEEAYFLAHRQQILRQQAQAAAGGTPQPGNAQAGGRPKPPPRSMPGSPAPGKKSVADMSEQEWKQNLKESGIVKELLSRKG